MISVKSVFINALFFCGAYFLLLALFSVPAIEKGSNDFFAKTSGAFLTASLPDGFFHVEAMGQKEQAGIVRVVFGNREKVERQMAEAKRLGQAQAALNVQDFRLRGKEFFLIPLLFFLALLLITPMSVPGKLKSAALGILLLFVFLALKLFCYAFFHFTKFPVGVYELQGWKAGAVTAVYDLKIGVSLLVATLVWASMAFWKGDWRAVLGKF